MSDLTFLQIVERAIDRHMADHRIPVDRKGELAAILHESSYYKTALRQFRHDPPATQNAIARLLLAGLEGAC